MYLLSYNLKHLNLRFTIKRITKIPDKIRIISKESMYKPRLSVNEAPPSPMFLYYYSN